METLIRGWLPFSSPSPSLSIATFSHAVDEDVEMDMGMGDEERSDADDHDTGMIDPGVSERVFDWTEYISMVPEMEERRPFDTYFRGIQTMIDIPSGVYLGDIEGDRKYIWEVSPDAYDKIIWVYEDCVIDCSERSKCNILSYVREGYYEGFNVNCKLMSYSDPDGEWHVGLETTKAVGAGEELIYWHPEMV